MLLNPFKQKREEEMKQMKADAAKKAGFAFVVGSAIGTVAALFTAPKSGKELRKDVKDTAVAGADKVKEGAEVLAVKTAEALEETVEFGKNVKTKFHNINKKEPVDKVKDKIDAVEDSAKDAVEDAADVAEDAAEAVDEKING
ncbi:YtxH domain-containing protein [Fusibacter tunisiensis]|uniref:Gas vesicle protein n=1 Tax=Fusibacter tunisiensis TaxID=1008308 RepID=A0ABS2MNQ6_9FIRM|nr:YtxH domain-containing protein [Fusibacter tunisiensis]MBM7561025.1 gas vesicle protein [Fusibacter tunisiensis]